MRSILHIRINSFFAAVELLRRPELAFKQVIVFRPRGNTTGVVVSASREAMKLGVNEGMSLRQAQRSCPDAVVIEADYAVYRQLYERLLDILAHYTPLLEPDLPGCAFLDVTGSRFLFGDAREIAEKVSLQIYGELSLVASIGCASNKLAAKIASGMGKRIVEVSTGSEQKAISQSSVTVLGGVDKKIAKRLGELGVTTVGELAQIPERMLIRQFGPAGSLISRQSLGIDASEVKAAYPLETIATEHMCDCPLLEPAEVEDHLRQMVGEALVQLRKRGSLAGEIILTLQLTGPFREQVPEIPKGVGGASPSPLGEGRGSRDFLSHCRPRGEVSIPAYFRFKKPTDSAYTLIQALLKMLDAKMQPGMEVTRIQVVLSDLTAGESSQLCLLGEGERKRRIGRAIELVRERFGERSVTFASTVIPGSLNESSPRRAA